MAVTRRPKREKTSETTEAKADKQTKKEKDIDAIINKGGSVPSETQKTPEIDELKNVQLRLYQSMINEIDEKRSESTKRKKPSRHQWILEAIEEKLNK